MPRIAGINIPDNKRVEIGIGYVFGIGPTNGKAILTKLKIDGNPKFSELTQTQIDQVRDAVEKQHIVEGDLRQVISQNIRRLKDISAYRGTRHARNLPVRGQRTKTNGRTKRGKRVTMGSGRKKSNDKT
jgi:small subunit ribosomal protein S13